MKTKILVNLRLSGVISAYADHLEFSTGKSPGNKDTLKLRFSEPQSVDYVAAPYQAINSDPKLDTESYIDADFNKDGVAISIASARGHQDINWSKASGELIVSSVFKISVKVENETAF
jgi:hypothetical protein